MSPIHSWGNSSKNLNSTLAQCVQLLLSCQKLQKSDVKSQFSTSETYQIFLKMIFLLEFVISRTTFVNGSFDLSQNLRSLFTKIEP